jgi:hypothetical protein
MISASKFKQAIEGDAYSGSLVEAHASKVVVEVGIRPLRL